MQNLESCNAKRQRQRWRTVKNNIGLISKNVTLHVLHTSFFVHFFAVVLPEYNVKLPETSWLHVLLEEMSYVFSFTFFSLPLIFTLHWWPLAFLILSPPLKSFRAALPTKNVSFGFFTLSFAGLPPIFSFSLSFSCSIFQICGHDNLSKLNTLDITDTETIYVFVFIDSLVVSALRDAGWICDFPSK